MNKTELVKKRVERIHVEYANSWILVDDDYKRVYASASKFGELIKKAKDIVAQNAVIRRVPEKGLAAYVG